MDECKTIQKEKLIETVVCDECKAEMGIENTQSQDGTLFVWYLCECGERLLKKYEDNNF